MKTLAELWLLRLRCPLCARNSGGVAPLAAPPDAAARCRLVCRLCMLHAATACAAAAADKPPLVPHARPWCMLPHCSLQAKSRFACSPLSGVGQHAFRWGAPRLGVPKTRRERLGDALSPEPSFFSSKAPLSVANSTPLTRKVPPFPSHRGMLGSATKCSTRHGARRK
jgi:hypothetical protein